MCSNMCASPVLSIGSCTEPTLTCVKKENTGASGRSQIMTVSPLASFLTVVRFSKELRSCPRASEQSTKHTRSVCRKIMRDFIRPPKQRQKSKLRAAMEDCQTISAADSDSATRGCEEPTPECSVGFTD